MNPKGTYRAGLYCRLSKDDDQQGESASIATQRAILSAYCQEQGSGLYRKFDNVENRNSQLQDKAACFNASGAFMYRKV